nr:accessory factor UbiK family protein [Neptunomonas japonica]
MKSISAVIEGKGFSRYSGYKIRDLNFLSIGLVKMNEKIIEGLSTQFSQMMNTFNGGADLPGQQQVKVFLQSALSKMDLVTRDEFDAQAIVLGRTREKVEQLEKVLAEIESRLDAQESTDKKTD